MSGGSFNYLCHCSAAELFDQADDLRRMAEALAELDPYADAHGGTPPDGPAQRTAALLTLREHIDAEIDALRGVWRAVEWWQSADWSRDQALVEIGRFYEQGKQG